LSDKNVLLSRGFILPWARVATRRKASFLPIGTIFSSEIRGGVL
jgi:hypothetical protein